MVAAWQEAEVIEHMLEHNLRSLDYDHAQYDIFVGTYCNDADTQKKVDLVARRARNVHKIVVPHDGPTCKADCLNWIYQGIVLNEKRSGRRYDVLLMHDAEDVIHPLALRLYARLIPQHDFVQTPVFSLPVPRSKLVAGTYIDEFAEHHLKDMLVREAMGGLVPSAGVGSAFARDAFEEIAGAHGQKPFNPESLTEDYEIGLKFRLAGKKVHFACHTIERKVTTRGLLGERTKVEEEYIATREYFPDELAASVRQRSRWVLGISLQTWAQLGWQGPAAVLYNLYRDRKALLTNALLLGAYLLLTYFAGRTVADAAGVSPWNLSQVVPDASPLEVLLTLNIFFLAWRTSVKVRMVSKLHGLAHGLMSVPRLVLGNLIGLFATSRAVWMYAKHRITGRPLRWLKTKHAFPNHEVLRAERRRLGEFLVDRKVLSEGDLDRALDLQQATSLPLGEVLSVTGVVPADEVSRALGEQLEMAAVDPDPNGVPRDLLTRLSEAEAEALGVLPLAFDSTGCIQVAFASEPDMAVRLRVEEKLGRPVVPVLAREAAIARARRRAYRTLVAAPSANPGLPLGQTLVQGGHLPALALAAALAEQRASGERLGDLLVRKRLVSSHLVAEALDARRQSICLDYRQVRPEEVEVEALQRLGYGMCTFYGLVPLRAAGKGQPVAIASAFPLHPHVLGACADRLGIVPAPVLAPAARRAARPGGRLLRGLAGGARRGDGRDGRRRAARAGARGPARRRADGARPPRPQGRAVPHRSHAGSRGPHPDGRRPAARAHPGADPVRALGPGQPGRLGRAAAAHPG